MLLEFAAAFPVIDHSILTAKLRGYGLSYLSGRPQREFFNDNVSDTPAVFHELCVTNFIDAGRESSCRAAYD